MSKPNQKHINYVTKKIKKYFKINLKTGFESGDRRFKLKSSQNTNQKNLIFNSDSGQKSMSLGRLLTSLTLSNNKLYKFLDGTKIKGQSIQAYGNNEKLIIKAFVRLAGITIKSIPSLKVRKLCKS